jgi:frataxin-like iron-binding protein CyaY
MSDVNVSIINGEAHIEVIEPTLADQIYDKLEALQDQTVTVTYDPGAKTLTLEFSDASQIVIDVEEHVDDLSPIYDAGGKFYVTATSGMAQHPGTPNLMCPC